MLHSEQELAVKVREVDCVQVDYVDLPEAGQDKILEKLAPDATSTHHEDSRLGPMSAIVLA